LFLFNEIETECKICIDGFYKNEIMTECVKCPFLSKSSKNKDSCELVGLTETEESMHNLDKFGTDSKVKEETVTMPDCIIGPYNDEYGSTKYLFSLAKFTNLSSEKYPHKKSIELLKGGYVFGLRATIVTEKEMPKQPPEYFLPQLENYGTRLISINTSQCDYGKIVLNYADGDICEGTTRHSSSIIMLCDIKADKAPVIQHIPENSSSKF